MTFSYDYQADALYIEIAEASVARTEQFDAGTMVDLDQFGRVVGIELLQPARDWPLDEIQARFQLDEGDRAILNTLWGDNRPYPFARPPQFVGMPA